MNRRAARSGGSRETHAGAIRIEREPTRPDRAARSRPPRLASRLARLQPAHDRGPRRGGSGTRARAVARFPISDAQSSGNLHGARSHRISGAPNRRRKIQRRHVASSATSARRCGGRARLHGSRETTRRSLPGSDPADSAVPPRPIGSASRRIVFIPAPANDHAQAHPVRPPPTMTTSASKSPLKRG